MLVDSHCHLDYDVFQNDFEDVISNAKLRNVEYFQTICTKISEFDKIKKIIEKYDFIYGSVGNHPHEVEKETLVSAKEIIKFASHKKIIGIGETGLDYYYEHSDRKIQQISFINHIEAARELFLPVIIHTRDAEEDTIKILESELKKGHFKALIHCFTSSKSFADKCLEMGLYISLSGIITFKNSIELQNTVRNLPLDRLLIETDSPYLAPIPNRGKRNEPAFVSHVAEVLANLKDVSLDEVSKITSNNFFTLFSKADQLSKK